MKKNIYIFSKKKTEGSKSLVKVLGGKGANLAEMCRLGIPVPPGFTITTDVCNYYLSNHLKVDLEMEVYVLEKWSVIV